MRSAAFLLLYFVYLVIGVGLAQRIIILPLAWVLPRRRTRIIGSWIRFQARVTRAFLRVGAGVRIRVTGALPETSCLVVMNHQSVLDIIIALSEARQPALIPVRTRYWRGLPGVSPIVRAAGFPPITQRLEFIEQDLAAIAGAADRLAAGESSLVIFPEGHRSRTGELGRFMPRGLRVVLQRARPPVYCVVADGMWRVRTFADAMIALSGTEVEVRVIGPFAAPERDEDHRAFIDSLHTRMTAVLQELRAPGPAAALEVGLDDALTPQASTLAADIASAFGPSALAVVHYGSRAQGRTTHAESAHDFIAVVDDYAGAFRALSRTRGTHYPPWIAHALARVLAPNVVAIGAGPSVAATPSTPPSALRAKVAVLSARDFLRETSNRARDHFVQGRVMQHVVLGWVRDDAAARLVRDAIAGARRRTLEWGRPYIPSRFGVDQFCEALLAASLRGDVRPEAEHHAAALVAAQRGVLQAIYGPYLEAQVASGALRREGDSYVLQRRVSRGERWRQTWYFRRSKARATLRLFKHVVLFEGWLEYVVHKVARSSGEHIELTERERRWPLIFLWPKFIRFLRTRPHHRVRHESH